jgi:uncharacterized protein YbjT (DUF2867 family)
MTNNTILVIGSTGKTGKRVVNQLEKRGIPVQHGSRSAEKAERVVMASGLEWTIVRCAFFAQNFNEGAWLDEVLAGAVSLPVDQVQEPFVDADAVCNVSDPTGSPGR